MSLRVVLEEINNIDKPLARVLKLKRERTQRDKIMIEKGKIKSNTTETQTIIREYYEKYMPKNWTTWKK